MGSLLTQVKIFMVAALCIAALFAAYSYMSMSKEIDRLEGVIAVWKTNYLTARTAQEASEEQIKKLNEGYASLQEDLLEWRRKYVESEQASRATQARIKKLRSANEKINNVLNTVIDCRVWRELFPDSARCYNSDSGLQSPESQLAHPANLQAR